MTGFPLSRLCERSAQHQRFTKWSKLMLAAFATLASSVAIAQTWSGQSPLGVSPLPTQAPTSQPPSEQQVESLGPDRWQRSQSGMAGVRQEHSLSQRGPGSEEVSLARRGPALEAGGTVCEHQKRRGEGPLSYRKQGPVVPAVMGLTSASLEDPLKYRKSGPARVASQALARQGYELVDEGP
jgi:hypothetical protein